MIKRLFKIIILVIIFFLLIIFCLSYFGVETSRFNSVIKDQIKKQNKEIDIKLNDREIWKSENFEAKIYHIPGHTSGHVCYHFFKQNILFTGDTLFSLGCGRIFEGTYEEMFNSLNLIKSFPKETKIYCGHEYTKNNGSFCISIDKDNKNLQDRIQVVKNKMEKKYEILKKKKA